MSLGVQTSQGAQSVPEKPGKNKTKLGLPFLGHPSTGLCRAALGMLWKSGPPALGLALIAGSGWGAGRAYYAGLLVVVGAAHAEPLSGPGK